MLPVYCTAPATKLDELFILQKKAVKNIFKLKWDHPTATLFRDNIFSLHNLIELETCTLFHKIKFNLIKNDFNINTRPSFLNTITRQHNLHPNYFTSREYILQSFFFKAPNIYNNLPLNIRSERNLIKFKTQIQGNFNNDTDKDES